MAYQPIKIIAEEQTTDGHVNRETAFDSTPQSNKINYQTGLPLITATPKSLGGKGPRRVDLNGIFYLFSSNLFELQQGNFPTYNSAIVGTGKPLPNGYPQGAVLWYAAGGYFVKSLVANNTESDLSDINSWEKITISQDEIDKLTVKTGTISGVNYRLHPDGYCEQFAPIPPGELNPGSINSINYPTAFRQTLPFVYADRYYQATVSPGYYKGLNDSITEKMSRVLKTRDDMIEFYGYLDTSYARSWKTEGYIIGRLLYCQYMFDIVFSASITQLGGDYQIQKGKKYRIELNASNGALIICTHIFETDGVINFFRIPGGMNNSSGYGAMAKFNDSLILVAGGGAGGTSGENPVSYGGGGYNGGYGTYPGLSYNGELGNSTEQNPNGGGRYNPSPTVGYGGTGYVHADLVNDTTIINVGDTDLINHSQNTGYVGSYVRLIEMI